MLCRRRPCAATARPRAGARRPSRRVLGEARLAGELRVLVLDGPDVAVEDDALAAGERDKPLSPGTADQCESGLTCKVDPQAVKPEREIRIGMLIWTVLITISEVRRPVV